MDSWIPWASGAAVVISAIIAGVFAWINRRGGERARREPTWGELVEENRKQRAEFEAFRENTEERFSALDVKFGAFVRVLTSLAEQWPADHSPELDPTDIEQLGTTLPVKFRPRRRPKPTTT